MPQNKIADDASGIGSASTAGKTSFGLAPPWQAEMNQPLYANKVNSRYKLGGFLAFFIPAKPSKSLLHWMRTDGSCASVASLKHFKNLPLWMPVPKLPNGSGIPSGKKKQAALDAWAKILLPLLHWATRFPLLEDPDSTDHNNSNRFPDRNSLADWERDSPTATKAIAAQLQETVEHAILAYRCRLA
jgi:hypothetical protein